MSLPRALDVGRVIPPGDPKVRCQERCTRSTTLRWGDSTGELTAATSGVKSRAIRLGSRRHHLTGPWKTKGSTLGLRRGARSGSWAIAWEPTRRNPGVGLNCTRRADHAVRRLGNVDVLVTLALARWRPSHGLWATVKEAQRRAIPIGTCHHGHDVCGQERNGARSLQK